ncbi:S8 family serine peptidase [Streptomyces sp. NPDC058751]|uniref:S8 family serine peptidase n=1 Tax=Streptomyces sp. NPDC058751 TaxID=3346623 RepID=UPI0036C3BB6D
MKRPMWTTAITAVMAVTLGAIPTVAHATAPQDAPAATDTAGGPIDPPLYDKTAAGETVRVNVVTENRSDLADAAAAGRTLQSFDEFPVVTLRVDRSGLDQLASRPGVVSVTEDVPVLPSLDHSVPLIGGDKAAQAGLTGAGSAVAVLDSGVATRHPFLRNRVTAEACFSPADPGFSATSLCPDGTEQQEGPGTADSEAGACATIPACDHGTHVAGIIAGNGKDLTGAPASGVAPGVGIVAIQVFSKFDSEDVCGPGSAPCVASFDSAQLAGLEKVLQLKQAGTPIVAANLSLGSGGRNAVACDDDLRKPAIDSLLAAGVATVVAAGNNGHPDAVSAPGCISSAITVGSTTNDDELSAFTNRGPLLDLLAPGTGITSSVPGGRYAAMSGTSMAAPHVAGALAVLRQKFPDQSITALASHLRSTGKAITYTGATTPRIDITRALAVTPGSTPENPPDNTPEEPDGTVVDFNGDRIEDIAVADPKATVGGNANAGLVRVVYGGGKGTLEINQDLGWVAGGTEPGDGFGESLATVDYNKDGYTDLVVGAPAEDSGSTADAGFVEILYGAPGGIGTGALKDTHLEQGVGEGALGFAAPGAGDRLGHSLAAGTTNAGEPFIVIGTPGEAVETAAKAGAFFYVHGSTSVRITQNSSGVPGGVEANDGYGTAVAADSNHFVVSAPNEAMGSNAGAGGLTVFDPNKLSQGMPTPLFGLDQDQDTVTGAAEPGDGFGTSLAIVPYRPAGTPAPTESILAVGSPGEDLTVDGTARADAGNVMTFRITAKGTYGQMNYYASGTNDDDVTGGSEAGDRFGQALAAVNSKPDTVSIPDAMTLAVGIPNEVLSGVTKAGAVQTFDLLGAPGANDRWLRAGYGGIPGSPGANQQVGSSIHLTGSRLYVGMPYGPVAYGVLYSIPLPRAWAGGSVPPVITYRPGAGGLPAAGSRFGTVAR